MHHDWRVRGRARDAGNRRRGDAARACRTPGYRVSARRARSAVSGRGPLRPARSRQCRDAPRRAQAGGVAGCRDGRYRALVTAPIAKSVINDAGIPFTGHTEFLAGLTGTALPVMLLVAGDLRVALATTHLPLRDVPDYLTAERLREVLTVLERGLREQFRIAVPDILVCGLNPHAGEAGHLGSEEQTVIAPVLDALRAAGLARWAGPRVSRFEEAFTIIRTLLADGRCDFHGTYLRAAGLRAAAARAAPRARRGAAAAGRLDGGADAGHHPAMGAGLERLVHLVRQHRRGLPAAARQDRCGVPSSGPRARRRWSARLPCWSPFRARKGRSLGDLKEPDVEPIPSDPATLAATLRAFEAEGVGARPAGARPDQRRDDRRPGSGAGGAARLDRPRGGMLGAWRDARRRFRSARMAVSRPSR